MSFDGQLVIDGMHCGACVRRLTLALERVDGVTVKAVEVGRAEVEFDSATTSLEEIVAAVAKTGFTAHAVAGGG